MVIDVVRGVATGKIGGQLKLVDAVSSLVSETETYHSTQYDY